MSRGMRKQAMVEAHTVDVGEGWTARVGKSAVDNDLLTFQEAFPRDWWLHVKGCAGSHVILQHAEEDEPSREVLEAAARLAVKYSKAGKARRAAVTLARVQEISKAKGSPAGQVQVRKSRTLQVRMPEA